MQAFIRLESLQDLSEEQRQSYERLALEMFTKYIILLVITVHTIAMLISGVGGLGHRDENLMCNNHR